MYDDLLDIVRRRGNHLFWHAVATQRSVSFRLDVTECLESAHSVSWIDCSALPVDSHGDLASSALDVEGHLVVLDEIQAMLGLRNGPVLLRQLRPLVMDKLESGGRTLVISRAHQGAFPVIEGSSLIHDGFPLSLNRLSEPLSVAVLGRRGFSERHCNVYARESHGHRGVLSRFIAESTHTEDGSFVTVPKPERKVLLLATIADALVECGEDALGTAIRLLDTTGRAFPYGDCEEPVLARLKRAGLASVDAATDTVTLLPGLSDAWCREAVALADEGTLSSRAWTQLAEDVFYIERRVRELIATRLRESPEGTVEKVLDPYSRSIANNWRQDYEKDGPLSSSGPVSPLSFMNLTDLLAISQEMSRVAHLGGLSAAKWREMADDLVPVRNRFGHVRLPAPGDTAVVKSWRRALLRAAQPPDRSA